MYDTVFFDLDGTLTDSAPGILNAIRHAFEKMARPVPDAATLNRFLGPPLIDSFQRHAGMSPADAAQALRYFREYFETIGLYENRVYEGVVPMLESLRRRGLQAASLPSRRRGLQAASLPRKLVLATAKPELFARRILDHFNLTPYFDAIHGATMDERRNDKTSVIAWALAHTPELGRVVMVGDRANDIEGAKANGLDSIGVLYGYGDEAELKSAGATKLAATPADVVTLLAE